MKILIFGDVYGRVWRNALKKELPRLKAKFNPDFTVVNVENITSGRGPIEKHVKEIEKLWIDVMTGWDHIFDNQKNIEEYLEKVDSKLIRPANFIEQDHYYLPGKGYKIVEKDGKKLLVIHLMWTVFMNYSMENPFLKAEKMLKELWAENFDAIVIDFHKETTSEWYGLAHFLDGQVSFVCGTHTHIQTNDELILPGGTWLISDVWMNGPLYSVIWADFNSVRKRFLTGINKGKIEQQLDENYVVNGICVEIWDDRKVISLEKIRIRGKL
jgi:metallophosphoesterase (TIGR00282 family)